MMRRLLRQTTIVFLGLVTVAACGGVTASGGDGGDPADAKSCVMVDVTTYDRSCALDSDCMVVAMGQLCTGQCGCGTTPINKKESARYTTATSSVKLQACPCASPGVARCVSKACVLCGFSNPAPGCPDGG